MLKSRPCGEGYHIFRRVFFLSLLRPRNAYMCETVIDVAWKLYCGGGVSLDVNLVWFVNFGDVGEFGLEY